MSRTALLTASILNWSLYWMIKTRWFPPHPIFSSFKHLNPLEYSITIWNCASTTNIDISTKRTSPENAALMIYGYWKHTVLAVCQMSSKVINQTTAEHQPSEKYAFPLRHSVFCCYKINMYEQTANANFKKIKIPVHKNLVPVCIEYFTFWLFLLIFYILWSPPLFSALHSTYLNCSILIRTECSMINTFQVYKHNFKYLVFKFELRNLQLRID